MAALDRAQAAMIQAIDHGPDFLPGDLFAGPRGRVLAGMKVHANTISHARLVALEETFPRTLAWLGHECFNEHSRLYIRQPGVTARPLARIGAGFAEFLARSPATAGAADLARFEWLWLAAYHAEEAAPLQLADLAGLGTDALMTIVVQRHPAASLAPFDAAVHRLIGAEVPGLAQSQAILLARPESEVLVFPATAAMRAVFSYAENPATLGNLLAAADEPGCEVRPSSDDLMSALVALLEAGALRRADPQQVD